MDRAHRLGQTKQVTVYRLICKGTIEERILERAREKSEIQRMVIQGGSFKGHHDHKGAVSLKQGGEHLKPKEVVSLLLDDDEMKSKLMLSSGPSSGTSTPVGGGPLGSRSGLKGVGSAKRKWDDSEGSEPALSRPDSPEPLTAAAIKCEPKKNPIKKRPSSSGKKTKSTKS